MAVELREHAMQDFECFDCTFVTWEGDAYGVLDGQHLLCRDCAESRIEDGEGDAKIPIEGIVE